MFLYLRELRLVLLLFGILSGSIIPFAQEPGTWHITDRDGLPSMTVYDLAQDEQGYIWMGTAKGICRFDGQQFNAYKSSALKDSEILKIRIDDFGRVWFSNLSGQLFYIEKGAIVDFEENLTLDNGEILQVRDFVLAKKSIWITIRKVVDGEERFYFHRIDFPSEKKSAIFTHEKYMLIISSFVKWGNRIHLFGRNYSAQEGLVYSHFVIDENKDEISEQNISSKNKFIQGMVSANDDKLWLGSLHEGIYQILVFQDGQFKEELCVLENGVNSFHVLGEEAWITTRSGIELINLTAPQQKRRKKIFKDIFVNRMMIDQEGNKWLGTTGKGVMVITAQQTNIYNSQNFNLLNEEIYCLEYDAKNELLLIGQNKGSFTTLDAAFNLETYQLSGFSKVNDILVDHENNYWVTSDLETNIIDQQFILKNDIRYGFKVMLESQDNMIWLGSYNSIQRLNHADYLKIQMANRKDYMQQLGGRRTYAFLEDLNNTIWIGTTEGLYKYDDGLVPYLEKGKANAYNISSMTQSNDSTIWIATRGEGMLLIKGNQIIQRITAADGLASNTVNALFHDDEQLWIGTDNGINKLNYSTNSIEWINTSDGLPSMEINDIIVVKSDVWAGTPKGLVQFAKDANHVNATAPPIYIQEIKIEERDTALLDSLTLTYNQNSIQLSFLGIAYNAKGKLNYEYKLSGIDKNWVSTTARSVRYPNLSPGDYSFAVRAVSLDGVKSEEPARFYLSIGQAWWKSGWFYASCFLLVAAAVGYSIFRRLERKRKEQEFRQHVEELKTRALRSQMNPHFIFNALNAIQQFLTTNNQEQAMHYLGQFAVLIRLIFEQSQKEKISLEEELEFLNLYLSLEKLRFLEAVEINLTVDPELLANADEIDLPALVIQPIVENSFKHGFLYQNKQGILNIEIKQEAEYIICRIRDNGIGRKKAAELGEKNLRDRPSSGLKTATERLAINNRNKASSEAANINIIDLSGEQGEVQGTLVEVRIHCPDLVYL